jgi:hypothetical protein
LEEFFDREFDIFGNLSQKDRGDIPPTVEGYGRATSIGMAELFMRPSLSDFVEAKSLEHTDDFPWLQDGAFHHG